MIYNGQICDGCKKPLDESEDIVVCPVCGTPQHRDCWEERGECVNADKHAEGFEWHESEQAKKEEKGDTAKTENRCAVCGKENPKDALTCHNCGAPLTGNNNKESASTLFDTFFKETKAPVNPFLYGVTEDPESEIDGVKVKDIACYVQNSVPRYVKKFKRVAGSETGKKKVSFNWAAFFFSPLWFFYRKMWKAGLVFMSFMLAITLAFTVQTRNLQDLYFAYSELDLNSISEEELQKKSDALLDASKKVAPMLACNLVMALAAGLMADSLYQKKVKKQVQLFRQRTPSERAFEAITLSKGGCSIFIAFTAYFGYNMVYSLLLSLASML